MGFPVLVKAVMGGGGKGMKLAHERRQFLASRGCTPGAGRCSRCAQHDRNMTDA